jgi:hypothetical protein
MPRKDPTAKDVCQLLARLPADEQWKFWDQVVKMVPCHGQALAAGRKPRDGRTVMCFISRKAFEAWKDKEFFQGAATKLVQDLDQVGPGFHILVRAKGDVSDELLIQRAGPVEEATTIPHWAIPLVCLLEPIFENLAGKVWKVGKVVARNAKRDAEIVKLKDEEGMTWGQILRKLQNSPWAEGRDGRGITMSAIRHGYNAHKSPQRKLSGRSSN